jgi:hypothetical protein
MQQKLVVIELINQKEAVTQIGIGVVLVEANEEKVEKIKVEKILKAEKVKDKKIKILNLIKLKILYR